MREAVLDAIRQGVPRIELQRACSLRSTQLEMWAKRHKQPSVPAKEKKAEARVFSVTDTDSFNDRVSANRSDSGELELRFSGWSISIRSLVQEGQG